MEETRGCRGGLSQTWGADTEGKDRESSRESERQQLRGRTQAGSLALQSSGRQKVRRNE